MKEKKFDYEKMRLEENLRRQLFYEVARLFVKERKVHNKDIKLGVYKWAESCAPRYYNKRGKDDIQSEWVRRRLIDAIENNFILLGEFEDRDLLERLHDLIPETKKKVKLNLAPDSESLLSQACLDFDEKLVAGVKSSDAEFVVGVSGGRTVLAFSRILHEIRSNLKWHKEIPEEKKKNVVICSLTAGGTRSNISALSDTVAANIAEELNVSQSGLLGPPSFSGGQSLNSFKSEEEVDKHIKLVKNANIILTSVGDVRDDTSLTSQIYKIVDETHLNKIRSEHKNLGDILYQCYDGYTGIPIVPSDNIKNKILTVITLLELRKMVKDGKTKCIVMAKGYNKGRRALRGLIVWRMASDIHMDIECSRGLKDAGEEGQ